MFISKGHSIADDMPINTNYHLNLLKINIYSLATNTLTLLFWWKPDNNNLFVPKELHVFQVKLTGYFSGLVYFFRYLFHILLKYWKIMDRRKYLCWSKLRTQCEIKKLLSFWEFKTLCELLDSRIYFDTSIISANSASMYISALFIHF